MVDKKTNEFEISGAAAAIAIAVVVVVWVLINKLINFIYQKPLILSLTQL